MIMHGNQIRTQALKLFVCPARPGLSSAGLGDGLSPRPGCSLRDSDPGPDAGLSSAGSDGGGHRDGSSRHFDWARARVNRST